MPDNLSFSVIAIVHVTPHFGDLLGISFSAPPLNPTGATGTGGLAAVVLSRVCPKGRDEGAPLTGSGRPPDNLAPGRGEKRPT